MVTLPQEVIGNISQQMSGTIGPVLSSTLSPIMPILQAVGIAFLVYLIFLIIKAIVGINSSLRLKRIAQNVEEINAKLDKLINKKEKKK